MSEAASIPSWPRPGFLREVRADLADTLEDVGSAMALLREAADFAEGGNLCMARAAAHDAMDLIASLEAKHSAMAERISKWRSLAEGGAE